MKKITALFTVLFILSACDTVENEAPPMGETHINHEENEAALGTRNYQPAPRPPWERPIYTACDGSIGRFDVFLRRSSAGQISLEVLPKQLVVNGPLLMIGIVSTLDNSYRVLEIAIVPQVEVLQTYSITNADILNFDRIYIRPANGSAFNDLSNVAVDAACELPSPN